MKKILIGVLTAGLVLVGATSVVAATYKSPAEVYAGLKGVTVEEAYAERSAGSSYGQLADQAGVLEKFKAEMLENKKAMIQNRVENGNLTQEQAELYIERIETNQANCDGSTMGAGGRMGQAMGGAFGKGQQAKARGMMGGFGAKR